MTQTHSSTHNAGTSIRATSTRAPAAAAVGRRTSGRVLVPSARMKESLSQYHSDSDNDAAKLTMFGTSKGRGKITDAVPPSLSSDVDFPKLPSCNRGVKPDELHPASLRRSLSPASNDGHVSVRDYGPSIYKSKGKQRSARDSASRARDSVTSPSGSGGTREDVEPTCSSRESRNVTPLGSDRPPLPKRSLPKRPLPVVSVPDTDEEDGDMASMSSYDYDSLDDSDDASILNPSVLIGRHDGDDEYESDGIDDRSISALTVHSDDEATEPPTKKFKVISGSSDLPEGSRVSRSERTARGGSSVAARDGKVVCGPTTDKSHSTTRSTRVTSSRRHLKADRSPARSRRRLDRTSRARARESDPARAETVVSEGSCKRREPSVADPISRRAVNVKIERDEVKLERLYADSVVRPDESSGEHSDHSNLARGRANNKENLPRSDSDRPFTPIEDDIESDVDPLLPDDPWLSGSYVDLPRLRPVQFEKTLVNRNSCSDDKLLLPFKSKNVLESSEDTAHLVERLYTLLTMSHYKIYCNPSRVDPRLLKASPSGSSVYFNVRPELYKPIDRSISTNVCFLTTGYVAYSNITSGAIIPSSFKTVKDHRLGLFVFAGEFQRAMTLLGNVAGADTLVYGFNDGVLPFTTKVEVPVEVETNVITSPKKAHLFESGVAPRPTGSNPLLSNIKRMNYPYPLRYEDKIPVFDARGKRFTFVPSDWDNLHRLPIWSKDEIPPYSLVTVGYTANTYVLNSRQSAGSTTPYLSLNIQFVVVHHMDK